MKTKKGMELSLNSIVVLIILVIVLIVMIYFFINHYGSNSGSLIDVGSGAIEGAKNLE